jgi:deazaflavin-dependent oxidoreductase (nitroreductase family)
LHTTPVLYLRDGDRLVVFASKGGAPTNPAWFHNLLVNPIATVEVGEESFEVKASSAKATSATACTRVRHS